MQIDPYILTFSALTVIATIWMGFWSAKRSKTASDFFVAGRSVSVGWNASAISGEYLSAASFMGVAGMVMSSGYDALWYPVCYACGYLFLLLFIAGPLRRFGAYTIPDFAEGRFDSPVFRKIAVVFVLFIGFFYTMPQMKGAGTTLAYIFPGMPYWAGVVLVGAVITLNVALGGMKGITLVQAFQYWLKMFAISVPIFVLMAVYGHYGKQVGANEGNIEHRTSNTELRSDARPSAAVPLGWTNFVPVKTEFSSRGANFSPASPMLCWLDSLLEQCADNSGKRYLLAKEVERAQLMFGNAKELSAQRWVRAVEEALEKMPVTYRDSQTQEQRTERLLLIRDEPDIVKLVPESKLEAYRRAALVTVKSGERLPLPEKAPADATWLNPFGPLTSKAANAAKLDADSAKTYALLYTYSLIIALVCGTAGLPHILVRFYTNPDGVAAKRTTMWVMILIGVFYLFPPVFGVIGRNLLPDLYAASGAKGTDKVVLELPRILNTMGNAQPSIRNAQSTAQPLSIENRASAIEQRAGEPSAQSAIRNPRSAIPWGSILSGITCAGAFAAFMSTFSGLLVSMTGAMAHDVYGRILRPRSTPQQRLRAFKVSAVVIGTVAILLGMQVEQLQINFMVGQAFAIAAASYFPLLFMSCWWRGMTMKGAAAGMLTGGLCALVAVTLTNFSDLKWIDLAGFWAAHPLLRILCEQPAIWTVPLAIGLMVVVSKLTRNQVPSDIRMKMLVLHAPEQLGLKQEYIQEHAHGH